MSDKVNVEVKSAHINLSPDAFHRWALHYYKCNQDFNAPHSFSPAPYFLLCRAIELELKSRHLISKTQKEVKKKFGHSLIKAYRGLDTSQKILNSEEENVLDLASNIYATKGFEYFNPIDALTAYSRYPDLVSLEMIARKFIGNIN